LGFPRKNLGVDLCDCLHYLIDCLILILIAQREKRIETCELIWKNLLLIVPGFSQQSILLKHNFHLNLNLKSK
jgi:hypothetical protein